MEEDNLERRSTVVEEKKIQDVLFAWLSFVAGVIFCRLFPVTLSPLGGMIFIVLLLLLGMTIVISRGGRLKPMAITTLALAVLLQASMFLTSNGVIHFFTYIYGLFSFMYLIYSAFDNNISGGFSDFIISDYFKAIFIMPFASFNMEMAKKLLPNNRKNKKHIFGKIILGIGLTIIPTIAIIGLLSYDESFYNIIESLFDFAWDDIVWWIFSIIIGFFIGIYVYGGYVSSYNKKCENIMTEQSGKETAKKLRALPVVSVVIAIVPVLAVYGIFFVSQWNYYVAAFGGTLPENMIYSDYAREGFFQLCVVGIINFVIICVMTAFTHRKNDKHSIVIKIVTVLTSVFTLVLIATALSKMILYIDAYGLTQLRVYTSFFMIWLAIVFVFVIIKLFVPKFKTIPSAILIGFLIFMFTGFGADGYIAKYNVDRYVDGSLKTVDVYAIRDLNEDGAEQLLRLADIYTEKYGVDFTGFYADFSLYDSYKYDHEKLKDLGKDVKTKYFDLARCLTDIEKNLRSNEKNWKTHTLPYIRAVNAFEKLGVKIKTN